MKTNSVQIGIRVSPDVSEALEQMGAERGLSKTALVRTIVYEYVRRCES